jgi:23S rRNA pseudouridine1911/1915/1917 synthase
MKIRHFTAGSEISGERLDVAVSRLAADLTRSRVQKLLEESMITVNDAVRKANYRVCDGDRIMVTLPPVRSSKLGAEDIALDVLYEDMDLLVLNKPKGLVVHPAAGHSCGTLVNALLHHCKHLSGIGGEARPGIVHRLDKDTSGVLVITKNDRAHLSLAQQFKEHSVVREYRAVVHGVLTVERGVIDANIARHPRDRKKMAVSQEGKGRRAVTHFRVLERFNAFTYIALHLETGRTHQIRVHLASIGHPVAGDPVYGPRKTRVNINSQALHARLLGFVHPSEGKYMEFSCDPPEDILEILACLRGEKEGEGFADKETDHGCGGHAPCIDTDCP